MGSDETVKTCTGAILQRVFGQRGADAAALAEFSKEWSEAELSPQKLMDVFWTWERKFPHRSEQQK